MPLLATENLAIRFGDVSALEGINFSLAEGSVQRLGGWR
jgi:ABC-type sugar transport system ATPase subunit